MLLRQCRKRFALWYEATNWFAGIPRPETGSHFRSGRCEIIYTYPTTEMTGFIETRMRRLVLILLFAFPVVVQAYPWCLMLNGVPVCRFITPEACYDAVARLGGDCRMNSRQVGVIANGPFCVITSEIRDCRYNNKRRCLANAQKLKGGCVRNTDRDLQRAATGKGRSMGCLAGEEDCALQAPELLEDMSTVSDSFLAEDDF